MMTFILLKVKRTHSIGPVDHKIFRHLDFTGRSEKQNLELIDSGDRFTLLWDCIQPESEFDVTYQLIKTGVCDTDNDTLYSRPFPVDIITPVRVGYRYELDVFQSDLDMYANSTYLFTVQSKQWQPGRGYVNGLCHDSVNITTPEGKCHAHF